jgi:hypothetical protein
MDFLESTICIPAWLVFVALILLGGSGGVEALVRLVELRRGSGKG